MFEFLLQGIEIFLQWQNFLAIFIGVIFGITIGSIPGLTVTMAVALLSPFTFFWDPVIGISFLVGVYKAGVYGGSISAILIRTPGTPAAAATVLDGYAMAERGYPKKALQLARKASFIGDSFSDIVVILVAAPLAGLALKFGPPEMFALVCCSLTIIAAVSERSIIKGFLAGLLGLLLATIGMDPIEGSVRFGFSNINLSNGIPFISMLIGLFAISEVLVQIQKNVQDIVVKPLDASSNVSGDRALWRDIIRNYRTVLRSSCIGTMVGAIPGCGASIAAFVSYGAGKRASKTPEKFGKGCTEGIIAAEAGNSAVCGATLIPTLTFGIPGDPVTAVLLGAFMIHDLSPGFSLFNDPKQAPLVYAIFIGMIAANWILLGVATAGIKILARVTCVPPTILFPIVIILCVIGSYAINNSIFDVCVMLTSGVLGYFMRKYGFSLPALLIAFLLGPMLEMNLRRALILSHGNWSIFFASPISLGFLILTTFLIARTFFKEFRGKHSVGPLETE